MQRDLVIVACAVSAGIHGALVPGHFAEGVGRGTGFVAAAALLGASAAAVTLRPASEVALAAAGVVLAGLLAAGSLLWRPRVATAHPRLKGTPT